MQTVAIDEDFRTCLQYAVTHDALLIEASQGKPKFDICKYEKDVIFHASVEDDSWISMVAQWGVHLVTISAPCPPWSGAGQQEGLFSDQGCLLPHMILRCRQLRPYMILLEQVSSFASHAHKNLCLDVLKHVGYKMVWQKVIDSAEFGGVTRLRWLALAVRRNANEVKFDSFTMWPTVPAMFPDMLKAIFVGSPPDMQQLELTQSMKSCAMDTTLLPPIYARYKNLTGEQLMQLRTSMGNQTLPTLMSMYGRQHALTRSTLERKGYYGHFFQDSTGKVRLLHPLELQMCHVTFGHAFSAKDLQEGWKQTGNMITCAHAMLVLVNALNAIQNSVGKVDVEEVFHSLLQNRLRVDSCKLFEGTQGQFLVSNEHIEARDWEKQLRHFDDLYVDEYEFRLPENHAWHPNIGLQAIEAFETASVPEASPVTQIDDESQDGLRPTIPFHPMLKGRLTTNQRQLDLWISSIVQPDDLCWQFKGQFSLIDCLDEHEGYAFELQYVLNLEDQLDTEKIVTPCVHEGALIFISLDLQKQVIPQLKELNLHNLQFDQFGILAVGQQFKASTLLLDFRVKHEILSQHACMIFAAFQQIQMSYMWDAVLMRSVFRIAGEKVPKKTMSEFWSNLFDTSSFQKLQLGLEKYEHANEMVVAYHHVLPIPPIAFATTLAVLATRQVLDALSESGQIRVVLKWNSKAIWDGPLNGKTNMMTISSLLQCAMFPLLGGKSMRLVHKAKQCCNVTVQELLNETSKTFVMIQLVSEFSGGTGAKESQRAYARNSLASTLLEQGFSLDWVSKTTNTLVEKAGLKQVLQISQLPPGKQRVDEILKLCENCSLSPPPHLTKAASKVASAGTSKARKRAVVQLDPADYQIEASFFITQQGAPLSQIQQVRHKSTGVVLMTMDQALPWIREQQTISTDELAMIVLGSHDKLQTALKCELLNVPCRDQDKRPVKTKDLSLSRQQ